MPKKNTQLALLLVTAIVLGIMAGSVMADSISPVSDVSAERSNAPLRPVAGSHALGARAPDPAGQEDWTVRTYRGATGLSCYEAGQVRDGVFGRRVMGDFRAHGKEQPSGMCSDLRNVPDGVAISIHTRGSGGPTPDRSVLYGLARPEVQKITVDGPAGMSTLRPDGDGTFLRVYNGNVDFDDLKVVFHYTQGKSKVLGPSEEPVPNG